MGALLGGSYGLLIKLGCVLAISVSLFGFGYYRGYHYATLKEKARVVDHIVVQTKYLPVEQKNLDDTKQKIQVVHDKVYVEVPKLVPDLRVCDVKSDALGLLNSNRGSLPASQ